MPSPDQILEGLSAITSQWQWLAALWHAAAAAVFALIVLRRISSMGVGFALAGFLASVSAMAWWSSNPFNGAVFAMLAVSLVMLASRMRHQSCVLLPAPMPAAGLAFVAVAWCYPHFVVDARPWTYLYAAPLGLIPCPTLIFAIGLTLATTLVESRAWARTLMVSGLTYGLIGVFVLGVQLDMVLIAAAVLLGARIAIRARAGIFRGA